MNLKEKLNTLIEEDRKALRLTKEHEEKQIDIVCKRRQRLNVKGTGKSYAE